MKYTLLHNIPELSPEEIDKKKDFNLLLQRRNELIKKRLFFKKVFLYVAISVVAVTLLFLLFQYLRNTHSKQKENFIAPVGELIKEENDIIIGTKTIEVSNKPILKVQRTIDQEKSNKQKAKAIFSESEKKDKGMANLSIQNMTMFEQAYPLVGMDSLQRYLNSNIKHPSSNTSIDSLIDGKVTVYFTIDTLGKPTEIYTETIMEKAFEIEATRLILEMPTWQPAKVNGKSVPSKLKISVAFQAAKN